MFIDCTLTPRPVPRHIAEAVVARQRKLKIEQARRDQAIEYQLDQGVPLPLALRIVDGNR